MKLEPKKDTRGHSWPDVAIAIVLHPAVSLFIGGSALILASACHLGYRLPFNDVPLMGAAHAAPRPSETPHL